MASADAALSAPLLSGADDSGAERAQGDEETIQMPEETDDTGGTITRWSMQKDPSWFLQNMYKYYSGGGFWNILLEHTSSLLKILFIYLVSIFFLFAIDFSALNRIVDNLGSECPGTTHASEPGFFHRDCFGNLAFDPSRLRRVHPGLVFLSFCFGLSWVVELGKMALRMREVALMRNFYHNVLDISDRLLQTIRWSQIVERFKESQIHHRIIYQKKEVTDLEVMSLIMRKDNFLIALLKHNVIDLKVSLSPCFSNLFKVTFFPELLQWNLQTIITSHIYTPDHKVDPKVKQPNPGDQQDVATRMRRAMRIWGVIGLLVSPILFCYKIASFGITNSSLIKDRPSQLAIRRWTNHSSWWMRFYNELDHYRNRRLNNAYAPAMKYIDSFSSRALATLADFFLVIFGGIISVLGILMIVFDEEFTRIDFGLSRSVAWWLGILLTLTAILRLFIPSRHAVHDPMRHFEDMRKEMRSDPRTWSHDKVWTLDPTHPDVVSAYSSLFRMVIFAVLEDVFGVFITPLLLIFKLPSDAERIVRFYGNHTEEVPGLGDHLSDVAEMLRLERKSRDQLYALEQVASGSMHGAALPAAPHAPHLLGSYHARAMAERSMFESSATALSESSVYDPAAWDDMSFPELSLSQVADQYNRY